MNRGILAALAAALLFGASTPLAKRLLGDIDPLVLAGLLYAGSGLGLAVVLAIRMAFAGSLSSLAWPSGREWMWLSGAILFGGIAGPILLMHGLATSSGASASLLLNLEAVLTALIAWFVFRENFDVRIALGMLLIVAGGIVLSWSPILHAVAPGSLLIVAACVCWAIDNNLTRKVSASDAVIVAGLKGMVAGTATLTGAALLGHSWPSMSTAATAALLGFLGYGVSLVLFVLALRSLGTARTGAYFSVAPFAGALLAIGALGEHFTAQLAVAGALMALGVWLHLVERHEHIHTHLPIEHVHMHRHDEHHRHAHDFAWDGREPHSHPHVHASVVHAHRHFPDVHHRHRH